MEAIDRTLTSQELRSKSIVSEDYEEKKKLFELGVMPGVRIRT